MADTTDWFDDVAAVLDADAEAPGVSEDTDSPSEDRTPEDAEPIAADDPAEDETQDASADEATDDADGAVEAAPAQPQIPWDSPENPYRVHAEALAEKARKADAYEALVRLQAQQRAQQLQRERMQSLSDGDPQRVTELQSFIQETHHPLNQQIGALEGEVETVAKAATVLDAAVRLYVPPELQAKIDAEVERLMRLPGGYSVLQNHIQTRQEVSSEADRATAELQKENARLRKQLQAKAQIAQRQESGADRVDSGPGIGGAFADRWAAATGTDAIDVILDSLAEPR